MKNIPSNPCDYPVWYDRHKIQHALLWLALLVPLFFVSYNFTNHWAESLPEVGHVVFDWETQIPLWAWTIVPYWSIDLLYCLVFLLASNRHELNRMGLRLLTAQLICISCFMLWPLQFSWPRPELSGFFASWFELLMSFDRPFNQAPSLHITLLMILWVSFASHARGIWRWLVHVWFALIGLSVLTTWQHHFIDVPTGMLAGFLAVWLWPVSGSSPLCAWRKPTIDRRRRYQLAFSYLMGAILFAGIAYSLAPTGLWLLWASAALVLVSLAYAGLSVAVFQKHDQGVQSIAARWLLAPYLFAARINQWCWTRRLAPRDEIAPGVWLGRLPARNDMDAQQLAWLDLTAEISAPHRPKHYHCLPHLDLVVMDAATIAAAVEQLELMRQQGPVLVCCALGFSRSAVVACAWLLLYGEEKNCAKVIFDVRNIRPWVHLSYHQQRELEYWWQAQQGGDVMAQAGEYDQGPSQEQRENENHVQ
ncbi:putative protein YnbD [Vibrio stylophorae]|uniref:Tyrosine specific protein phosphatases domain-containing protein n=1 Tax=Vibrio stylophorae TaxID=659351 RepID=A0ABN8DW00_9VIBR|nr:phosphatase PAP2/dual specificity phosphatase family protein [Vibrio stylophorae]CAH0535089.1 putative protein YnbD [Vibrio stylophorae]